MVPIQILATPTNLSSLNTELSICQSAIEELTAEMTSAYLCAVTGIGQPTIENSVAYIENWLTVLKNDKTLIIKAASQAQKAADYILNEKVVCD